MNNWYVVTGGPSTGKSTLLSVLGKMGHNIIPETARTIIDEAIASGRQVTDLRADEKRFQHLVLARKIAIEKAHPKELLTFFDRGMHDTLAYLKLGNYPIEEKVIEAVRNTNYKKVFLLDPLDNFEKDYARTETKEESLKLNQLLFDVFSDHGMIPVRVPAMSPEDRTQFVLQRIN